MSDTAKKGILVVSFGTSHEDTRAVTLMRLKKKLELLLQIVKFIAHGPAK